MPKLYEIPEGSKLRIKVASGGMDIAFYKKMDGHYARCSWEDNEDSTFFLSCSTPLVLKEDGVYEIED